MQLRKIFAAAALTGLTLFPGVSAGAGKVSDSEKLFLSADRDIYIAGEDVYFKLLLISGPENGSNVSYLVLRNEANTVISSFATRLEDRISYGRITLPDTLGTGVYHLSAFTNWMRNFGATSFTNIRLIVVNRFDEDIDLPVSQTPDTIAQYHRLNHETGINVSTCREVYGPREPVSLRIETDNPDSLIQVTVAVVPQLSVIKNVHHDDIPGTDAGDGQGINGMQEEYLKEDDGLVISGKVIDENSGAGVGDATILLNTPDTLLNLKYARSLADGRFYFRLNNYYDGRDLYFSVYEHESSGNLSLGIDDKTSLPPPAGVHVTLSRDVLDYISYSKDVVRVQKTYNTVFHEAEINHGQIRDNPPLIYSEASHTIFPGNFEPLDNFREITRELIRHMRIRRTGEDFQIRILDERADYSLLEGEPVVFVNGLPENNINNIINLGSDDIERIEIHNFDWVTGDIRFRGIVGLFTHNREYGEFVNDRPFTVFHNEKLLPRSGLRSVNHSEADEPLRDVPDFRQLLHWEPCIILDGNKNHETRFYTGDLTGNYLVLVTGITREGEKLSATVQFTIR